MNRELDIQLLRTSVQRLRTRLLQFRNADGFWQGQLSSSPLATAVGCFALHCVDFQQHAATVRRGLDWISQTQNHDGGWGDTDGKDPSNLSTSLLCRAALMAVDSNGFAASIEKVNRWIQCTVGSLDSSDIIAKVYQAYGSDRTFAVPILTMNALAGVFPEGKAIWKRIDPLPFELAVLPRGLFSMLNLKVVSYALPALIAIGQVRFHFHPSRNPLIAVIRNWSRQRTRNLLQQIQPSSGGFLEAAPLTGFVVMSLASMGLKDHPVVQKGVDFLLNSACDDGSLPIDTNLAIWVTTHAAKTLTEETVMDKLPDAEKQHLREWILAGQFKTIHPFTGAKPGGWGWTNLPGSVPDADDTSGALSALYDLCDDKQAALPAVKNGITWLLDLQNADGGIPTFCRGWGRFEFDRSCTDITAHAAGAFAKWKPEFEISFQQRMEKSIAAAMKYLDGCQNEDGSFDSLWFGRPENLPRQNNPVLDTARVIAALANLDASTDSRLQKMLQQGFTFLLTQQKPDGGWAAAQSLDSSIEETAVAVQALAELENRDMPDEVKGSVQRGVLWLGDHIEAIQSCQAGPIGLYFAKLWYYEKLYPLLFSLQALVSALRMFEKEA